MHRSLIATTTALLCAAAPAAAVLPRADGALAGVAAHGMISSHAALLSSSHVAPSSFVTWNAGSKTATLTVVAAYDPSVAGGFNFDGYNNGRLTFTIPVGAHVVVRYTNPSAIPHSAVITPLADHSLTGNFPLAFPGSASPNAASGVASLKAPQTFSFVASKAGQYALVCGVPGHAAGGMWDTVIVSNAAQATASAPGVAGSGGATGGSNGMPTMHGNGGTMGSVEGILTDASSGRPIVHGFMVLGWTSVARVGETDAFGHYRIDNVPPVKAVSAFGFAEGYVYVHGMPIAIGAGQVTEYALKMPRQTFADAMLPHASGATISPATVKPGQTATFSLHLTPGKGGALSSEVFAVNALFGHVVLLRHAGGDLYRASYTVPSSVAPGAYSFAFFGAMESCLENAPYLRQTLTVG